MSTCWQSRANVLAISLYQTHTHTHINILRWDWRILALPSYRLPFRIFVYFIISFCIYLCLSIMPNLVSKNLSSVSDFILNDPHEPQTSTVKWIEVPFPHIHTSSERWVNLLLNLMTAVWAGETDDHFQLVGGIIHKLSLQSSFFSFGGPGESFIQVQRSIETHGESDQTPAHRPPHLYTDKHSSELCHFWQHNTTDTTVSQQLRIQSSHHSSDDDDAHGRARGDRGQVVHHGHHELFLCHHRLILSLSSSRRLTLDHRWGWRSARSSQLKNKTIIIHINNAYASASWVNVEPTLGGN